MIVPEDYTKVLQGALAVEEEAFETYVQCACVATELAAYIRELGFPAIAEHNGTGDIQAIPAMHACGLGELGKHGSLIHREFGASFRPGFVITEGVKRWLVDIPACYESSRFRDEYCHICVDVCPYQHRENKNFLRVTTYRRS